MSPAVLTVKIDTANGKTSTLLVGEESPSGSVYAKLDGDPRLFTMSKTIKDSLDKSSKDLRDKRLLTFDSNPVSRVELNIAKQPPLEFGRSGAQRNGRSEAQADAGGQHPGGGFYRPFA